MNYKDMSEEELTATIEAAKAQLKTMTESNKTKTIQQIHELASTIGVKVQIVESQAIANQSRKGGKVPIKYRNPSNHAETWSGRGLWPKWICREMKRPGMELDMLLVR